jgi:SHAQKYF class myb-like DNA-binding protein
MTSPASAQSNPQQQQQLTTELIQKYLDENQQLILAILENQNIGRLEECIQYSARLQQNLKYLATIADSQPQATGLMYPPMYNYNQAALMPQMPQVPQTPPQMINIMDSLQQYPLTVPLPQPQKEKGNHWTTEEQQRFLAALELFGWKDIKKITDYVSTRTPSQVRSHLQKHQQKMTKVIGRMPLSPSISSGSVKRGAQLVITTPSSPFPQFNTPVTPQHFTPQTPILIPSIPATPNPMPLSPIPPNSNYNIQNNTNQ